MCAIIFSTVLSETFLILIIFQRDVIINAHRSSCKVLLFLSDFNKTEIIFDRFSKNTQISNFVKIRAVGAEWLHADGRAYGQKQT